MVTHLGAFDDDMNGLSTNIAVGLLNMDAQTVVRSVVLNGASHGSGNGTHWQFAEIASAVLVAGTNYAIAAYGFNASNENYNAGLAGNVGLLNFNTLSGAVTNTGSYAYPGPSFNFVGTFFPAANAPRFGGGNAVLSPVPEASTLAMMAAGLGVAGFAARRRKADS
ncbi:MAG: PEP-CTERM sorting domain-containing protein [Rubrivivax sp.]|nr:PEP-CTERM sorting domain-containing protein [Rubrivivax sp.]